MDSEELRTAYGDNPYATADYWVDRAISPKTVDNRNSFERVREFMETFGHPVYDKPQAIEDGGWEKMRLELIREEFAELLDATGYSESANWIRDVVLLKSEETDIVETADALGDLEYVTNALAHGMGINLPEVVKEIHRSNMTKLGPDGKPIYREDGKILKGEGYEPPSLYKVLWPQD